MAFERNVSPSALKRRGPAVGKLCSKKCRSKYIQRFQNTKNVLLLEADVIERDMARAIELAAKYGFAINERRRNDVLGIAENLRAAANIRRI